MRLLSAQCYDRVELVRLPGSLMMINFRQIQVLYCFLYFLGNKTDRTVVGSSKHIRMEEELWQYEAHCHLLVDMIFLKILVCVFFFFCWKSGVCNGNGESQRNLGSVWFCVKNWCWKWISKIVCRNCFPKIYLKTEISFFLSVFWIVYDLYSIFFYFFAAFIFVAFGKSTIVVFS